MVFDILLSKKKEEIQNNFEILKETLEELQYLLKIKDLDFKNFNESHIILIKSRVLVLKRKERISLRSLITNLKKQLLTLSDEIAPLAEKRAVKIAGLSKTLKETDALLKEGFELIGEVYTLIGKPDQMTYLEFEESSVPFKSGMKLIDKS